MDGERCNEPGSAPEKGLDNLCSDGIRMGEEVSGVDALTVVDGRGDARKGDEQGDRRQKRTRGLAELLNGPDDGRTPRRAGQGDEGDEEPGKPIVPWESRAEQKRTQHREPADGGTHADWGHESSAEYTA